MSELGVYVNDLAEKLRVQLDSDELRYGDEWKRLPREGQEERILDRVYEYYLEYRSEGVPVPWLKIIGLSLIALVREGVLEADEK